MRTKNFIIRIYKDIVCELKILITSPKTFLFRWCRCIIPHNIFGIKKDIYTEYLGYKIIIPNNHFVQCVLMETFMRELFSDIKGLNKVLDLGGFIGESAIYLSKFNKEIYTYEMSPKNFSYLKRNCAGIKNIKYFNGCISNNKCEYIDFSETGQVSSTNTKEQNEGNTIKIKNYNIIQLLKNNQFDGLKIDIEGGEYDILKPIIKNGLFNFKKGIIEFHDLDKKNNKEYFDFFTNFLIQNGYSFKIFDNEKKDIKNVGYKFCNIYYYK